MQLLFIYTVKLACILLGAIIGSKAALVHHRRSFQMSDFPAQHRNC